MLVLASTFVTVVYADEPAEGNIGLGGGVYPVTNFETGESINWTVPKVKYVNETYKTGDTKKPMSGLGKVVYAMAYGLYGGETFMTDSLREALDITQSGKFADAWTFAETLFNSLSTIGTLLLALYWLLDLLEKVQADTFTMEHFVKSCVKLIAGTMLMNNGLTLAGYFLDFANGIFSTITETDAAVSGSAQSLYNVWLHCRYHIDHPFAGLAALLGDITEMLFPYIMVLLIKIVLYVLVYGRVIELFARIAFAPIAMANIYSGGMNSSGARYLKKIVAVALTGSVILVILQMYSVVASIITQAAVFTSAIQIIVLGLATIMLIIKAQGWANDIMGV